MRFYLQTNLLIILFCLSYRYSSVKIKPELQKNVLKFGYGINYKYEGMLARSFDRFYVVTKFILPTLDNLKLSPIKYDKECNYLGNLDGQDNDHIKEHIKDLLLYCSKVRPYIAFYKMQIKACNNTTHHLLKNEVDIIFPKFPEGRKSKRRIFSVIISDFVGLAFEGISSFLHNKRHKALHKAVKAMSIWTDIQRNKFYAFREYFSYVWCCEGAEWYCYVMMKGSQWDNVVVIVDSNADDPMLLLLDNSDSPSIVEQ